MYEVLLILVAALPCLLFILVVTVAGTFPKTLKAFDKKLSEFIYGEKR